MYNKRNKVFLYLLKYFFNPILLYSHHLFVSKLFIVITFWHVIMNSWASHIQFMVN